MRWVAIFEDDPQMLTIRAERGEQHLAYLRQHAAEILIGGGLRQQDGSPFVGGLWVLEVSDRQRAVELIENDPYYEPAHRRYRLLRWGKAIDVPVTL